MAKLGLAIAAVAVVVLIVIAAVLLGAGADPEADMNDCEQPIAWTKAEGDISIAFALGAPSGSIDRIDVHTGDRDYTSDNNLLAQIGNAVFPKAGNFWVTSYATGPDGIVTPQRDSAKTPYEFGAETLYTGSASGTFRTGDVCVETHGTVTWTFILKLQNNGEEKIWTLATESRDVAV